MGTTGILEPLLGDPKFSECAVKTTSRRGQPWEQSFPALEWVAQEKKACKQGRHASVTSFHCHIADPVVSKVPQPDHALWTARIWKHAQRGQGRQALQVYWDMLRAGVRPSSYTFVAALKACKSLRDLESAKKIHAEVVESGFELDLYVGTALVDVYAKCGDFAGAGCVFEKMQQRDVVSWNAMILGCAQMDQGEQGLNLYARMRRQGSAVPNDRTFVAALKACKSWLASKDLTHTSDMVALRKKGLERVRALHTDLVEQKVESDVYVATTLVDVYARCGSLVDARHVFDKMPHRNVVAWTAIIMGYALEGEGEEALRLYDQMQQAGVAPDERTFVAVLKAWDSRTAAEEEGCHKETTLVQQQCLEQLDQGKLALDLYWQMKQQGSVVVPNERTLVGALKACISLLAAAAAEEEEESNAEGEHLAVRTGWCLEQVHAIRLDVVTWGYQRNLYVGSMLVDAYAKCGSLEDARQVFEVMPQRNVVCWTAMILGHAQMGDGEGALHLYSQMQEEGVVAPDERTYVAVLKACSLVSGLEKGMETHAQMLRVGIKTREDVFVANSLIDMYAKCGSMASAQQVFDSMAAARDVVTWNALIAGYARQGNSESVFHLFAEMTTSDGAVPPDGVTFLSVLTACSHEGLVEEGWRYFEAMSKDYGVAPTLRHYTCMVDLLGRAGQVDKALAMATTMPLDADCVVWQTVLGACQKSGNVELARKAFGCAVQLEHSCNWDGVLHAVMTNIYESAQLWEDAKEIDDALKFGGGRGGLDVVRGARFSPGQSWWADMRGTVHRFGAGNTCRGDPEREQMLLCAHLQNISLQSKEIDAPASPLVVVAKAVVGGRCSGPCLEKVSAKEKNVCEKESCEWSLKSIFIRTRYVHDLQPPFACRICYGKYLEPPKQKPPDKSHPVCSRSVLVLLWEPCWCARKLFFTRTYSNKPSAVSQSTSPVQSVSQQVAS